MIRLEIQNCIWPLCVLLVVFSLGSCDSTPDVRVEHPKSEFLPSESTFSASIVADIDNAATPDSHLSLTLERLTTLADFDRDSALKSRSQLPSTVEWPGQPMVSERSGTFYLIHPRGDDLLLVPSNLEDTRKLTIRDSTGKRPFVELRDIHVHSDSVLLLVDRQYGIRQLIVASGSPSVRTKSLYNTDYTPEAACSVGDTLFIHARTEESGKLITAHELQTGEVLFSFGTIYDAESTLVNYQLSGGQLFCHASGSASTVIFAPRNALGVIAGYSPNGALKWHTQIKGLQPMMLSELDNGPTLSSLPEAGAHSLLGITNVGPALLIQYGLAIPNARGENRWFGNIESFLIDSRTGAGFHVKAEVPFVGGMSESATFVFDFKEDSVQGLVIEEKPKEYRSNQGI